MNVFLLLLMSPLLLMAFDLNELTWGEILATLFDPSVAWKVAVGIVFFGTHLVYYSIEVIWL